MVLLQIINEIPEIAAPFFTAFKHEHNSPRKIPTGCKNLPHSDQHGCMAVMAAHMGHAGDLADTFFLAQKIARILLNRKCIHVRPQKHGFARSISLDYR